jgi:hypothetical protein
VEWIGKHNVLMVTDKVMANEWFKSIKFLILSYLKWTIWMDFIQNEHEIADKKA